MFSPKDLKALLQPIPLLTTLRCWVPPLAATNSTPNNKWCSQTEEAYLKEMCKIQKECRQQSQAYLRLSLPNSNSTPLALTLQENKWSQCRPQQPANKKWGGLRSGLKSGLTILLNMDLVIYCQIARQEYFSMIQQRL